MPRLKRPSVKMRKFAKAYIENGGIASKAVREAYDVKSARNASVLGNSMLQNPMVQKTIKEYLDKSGLNLEYISDKIKSTIDYNLENGKPSQAVGADLLKFSAKLQDVIPSSKSASISYSRKEIIHKTFDEIKEELKEINRKSSDLVNDL